MTNGLERLLRRPSAEAWVGGVIVAVASAFVFFQLHPSLIFADTTAAGGDMGAHVWGPAFLRDHLLSSGRLQGWAPDWYAGFPAYQFYMVVPSLFVVAIDLVLPYNVAFKLVTVSGLVALPAAAFALGRLARLPFPGPVLLGLATLPFIFDRSFTIYGGNAASTLAGEFAFTISLAFALVFLGLVLRGLSTGTNRAWAAAVLGLCALCHVIPAIFALAGAGVALLLRLDRARTWWLVSMGVVGSALTAFWTVPFVWRRPYLNDMGWEKETRYLESLFPGRIGESLSRLAGGEANAAINGDVTWVVALALVGAGASLVFRRRLGTFLVVLGPLFAVAFLLAPQGRLWNARLLPFWYLCLYLLAAVAVAEVAIAVATLVARRPEHPSRATLLVAPVLATVAILVIVGLPLRALPGGATSADGTTYRFAGITTTDRSFIPDWARWNYSGYERKDAFPEYSAVVDTMAGVGDTHGCGRAMWEYERELDRFGTPMALMLLPYWTDGCIDSMEGLFFEASVSTPYHFLNQSELSAAPSRAMRDLPYRDLDVDAGVEHLQLMGVKYYMAFSPGAVAAADVHPDLTLVDTTGVWRIYEVSDSEVVTALEALPAVLSDVPKGGEGWLDPAVDWYNDRSRRDVLLAAGGPDSWQRVSVDDDEAPERRAVEPVQVSDVAMGTDTISFRVDEPGRPVLVKTSYFPSWQAEGADGPFRVAPNLMVVVPTANFVELTYGDTPVDYLAWAITLAGIGLLVVLARRPGLALPERPVRRDEVTDPSDRPLYGPPLPMEVVEADREELGVPA